jgi:hypothetical protein
VHVSGRFFVGFLLFGFLLQFRDAQVKLIQFEALPGQLQHAFGGLYRDQLRYDSLSSSKYRSRLMPAVRRRFLMMNTGTALYAGITSGRRTPGFV